MRILIVHDTLAGTGGAERSVRDNAAALTEHGFRLAFLTAVDQRPAWTQAPIYTLSPSAGVRSGRRTLAELTQVLETVNPDLIFINSMQEMRSPLLLPLLLRRLVDRAPSVMFVHDVRLTCPNETKILRGTGGLCREPAGKACLRGGCCRFGDESRIEGWRRAAIVRWRLGVCREVGRFIVPSHYMAEELARNGLRLERIVVLPHFTERRPARPAVEPVTDLLWVGRFDVERTKGFEAFADMLVHLKDLPWHAAVAGNGELLPEAQTLVNRLGLGARVSFLGQLSDGELDAWYARTRVVVVTSRVVESFCMVGIEAMAHWRPVVAFDVGGIQEWLVDGVTGFKVPPGNTPALAQAVRRLLTEPALAGRFGEAGRALVEARFRRPPHVAGLLDTMEAARVEWTRSGGAREPRRLRRAMSVTL